MESILKYQQLFIVFSCLLVHCAHAFVLKGSIKFGYGKEPASLPAGSWLVVKLEDISLADASAKLISTFEEEIKDYPTKPLTYHMSKEMILKDKDKVIAVSAYINVGWKADADNCVRSGDYLTVTQEVLDDEKDRCNDNSYVKDVPVVHYIK